LYKYFNVTALEVDVGSSVPAATSLFLCKASAAASGRVAVGCLVSTAQFVPQSSLGDLLESNIDSTSRLIVS